MKTIYYLVFMFSTLSFTNLYSQEFELGKVSLLELQEKFHPGDSSASAAVLFKKGNVKYEFYNNNFHNTITEVKTRIKIYKKDGYEYANQSVNYYSGSRSNINIIFKNAITYNIVGGKIEKTVLNDEGKFKDNVNKFWTVKTITMPNVKEGSIIEFEYIVEESGIGTPNKWNFQQKIPINYSEFITSIPYFFTFNKSQKGFIFPKVSIERVLDRPEFEETKTTYVARNMPALKEEAFVNNIDNYTSSISHELSALSIPGRYIKRFSTDWETIAKEIYKVDDFNVELNKSSYFKEEITKLLKNLKSRDEKILAILNFVKNKVKWNNESSIFCHYGVKNAYNTKSGNVAEINLMLTAILRYADIEANPVLISTRPNGIVLFPSLNSFNYVIAAVEIKDDLILLDATEKFSFPNILPLRDLNLYGRLIRKEGTSSQVTLTPKSSSKEITNIICSLDTIGNINGKLRHRLTDNLALSFREKNENKSINTYLDELENKNKNIHITEYSRENDLNLSQPIVETYNFKDANNSEIIADKIYISPKLFFNILENPFKIDKREYPVDFGYPTQNNFNITIIIPDSYSVESVPDSINLVAENNLGSFVYLITHIKNKIQVQINTNIKEAIIPSDYYDILKNFYKQMIDKQNEKIVLVKK